MGDLPFIDKDTAKRFKLYNTRVPLAAPGQMRGQEVPVPGNCIQVRAASGVLTITTNKGDSDNMIVGEVVRFDNGFTSLRITSTVANDAISLSIGYGLKFNPANVAVVIPNPLPVTLVAPLPVPAAVRLIERGNGAVTPDLQSPDGLGLAVSGWILNGQAQLNPNGGAGDRTSVATLFGAAPFYTPTDHILLSLQNVPAQPAWAGGLAVTGDFPNSGSGSFVQPLTVLTQDRQTQIPGGVILSTGFYFVDFFGFTGYEFVNLDPAAPVHIGIQYIVEGKGQ